MGKEKRRIQSLLNPMIQNAKIHTGPIDPGEYHKRKDSFKRGDPKFPISPSTLKVFGECPSRWKDGYNPPDSDAKQWGNLLDCLVLTPSEFHLRYAVKPETYPAPKHHAKVKSGELKEGDALPWNANADYCDKWEVQQGGKEVISKKLWNEALTAKDRILANEGLCEFLKGSMTQLWVTAEWQDEATGLVIPLECLIDDAPDKDGLFHSCLGDLKSTTSAKQARFKQQCYEFGYDIQAAFDLDMFNAATKEQRTTWCFIVCENYPPFQTGKRMMGQKFLQLGRDSYKALLSLYCNCLHFGSWPDYDSLFEFSVQGWGLVELDDPKDNWMIQRRHISATNLPQIDRLPNEFEDFEKEVMP